MIQCISSFLDFCYLARRSSHTTESLNMMQSALDRFCNTRKGFIDAGVCPQSVSLPRQHSLLHYIPGIRLFGSPNGLCSSITESKHIHAVKRPYRRSNRFKALRQILLINQRQDKLSAARRHFLSKGLPLIRHRNRSLIQNPLPLIQKHHRDEEDVGAVEGNHEDITTTHLVLCRTPGKLFSFPKYAIQIKLITSFSLYSLGQ